MSIDSIPARGDRRLSCPTCLSDRTIFSPRHASRSTIFKGGRTHDQSSALDNNHCEQQSPRTTTTAKTIGQPQATTNMKFIAMLVTAVVGMASLVTSAPAIIRIPCQIKIQCEAKCPATGYCDHGTGFCKCTGV